MVFWGGLDEMKWKNFKGKFDTQTTGPYYDTIILFSRSIKKKNPPYSGNKDSILEILSNQ